MALSFSDKNGVSMMSPGVAVLGPGPKDSYTITVVFKEHKNPCVVARSGGNPLRIPALGTIVSVLVEGVGDDKWEAFLYDESAPGLLIQLANKPAPQLL